MKIQNVVVGVVLAIGLSFSYVSFSSGKKGHNMGSGMMGKMANMCSEGMGDCPMMMGERMEMMQVMHSDKVKLNIKELKNGVSFTWTSTDKTHVNKLKKMAKRMKNMHPKMQNMMKKHHGN